MIICKTCEKECGKGCRCINCEWCNCGCTDETCNGGKRA